MKYFLGAATAALMLAGASAASAAQASQTVNAQAIVISPLTETVTNNMNFGKLVLDSTNTSGTLILGTDNSRSVTGGVNLVGGATGQAAVVTFVGDTTNGAPNPYNVTVDTTTSLSDGHSHSMSVAIGPTATSPGTGLTGLTGTQAVTIGATLSVASSQAAGTYQGTFNVTGAYQ